MVVEFKLTFIPKSEFLINTTGDVSGGTDQRTQDEVRRQIGEKPKLDELPNES
ncbi:hypothetical protein [Legionella tunisiensis]|uniref:hypothetical protein n=1 Tax=Legionella tunisiensis TaxID=1034944 RepID=UPI001E2DAF2A|nr:hypothetical protein [Legionella tunisiensis]